MCFMSSPKEPPPPPPPPQAPPVLEQEAPKLSQVDENSNYLDKRAAGFKQYKIDKRNAYTSDANKLGGMVKQSKSNY